MRLVCSIACCLAFPLAATAADDAKVVYLDIQPLCNQKLAADQGSFEGNHLSNVPKGEQAMAGSKFKIGDSLIHLKGEKEPDLLARVDGIKVDASFKNLHILHSTGHGEGMGTQEGGSEIGAYIVHYTDKTDVRIPIIYGEDMRDWWFNAESAKISKDKIAWEGTNPAADSNMCKIRLYRKVWTNPYPDKKVESISYESKNTKCDPFLVALTVE